MPVRPISVADLGRNVRALRLEQGLSQESLAERAGIHVTYLSGIENAKRNPTISIVNAIADALDIAALDLLAAVS